MHAVLLLLYNALSAADNWWVKSCSQRAFTSIPSSFSLLFHLSLAYSGDAFVSCHEAAFLHPKATISESSVAV